MLAEFHTTLALFGSGWIGPLRRRVYPEPLKEFTRRQPWREAVRLASLRLGLHSLSRHEHGWASLDAVYNSLDRTASRYLDPRKNSAVYCYEDGALETFRAAEQLGIWRLYDLPIGYWKAAKKILSEEAQRLPEWASTIDGLRDSQQKLDRKDEELRLANRIIVASTFTAKTLSQCTFNLSNISVIPYGADNQLAASPYNKQSGPLRVLFVGSLSQRKGIADVFESVGAMGHNAVLTVIGQKSVANCKPLNTALKGCRWIPTLSREQILAEMRCHDVLVFPSLFEGFGLVVVEALSQGIPVITTPHTCGPDVLNDGEDGFLVPIRNPNVITEKLDLLASNRKLLKDMSEAAYAKAKKIAWADYRRQIVDIAASFSK